MATLSIIISYTQRLFSTLQRLKADFRYTGCQTQFNWLAHLSINGEIEVKAFLTFLNCDLKQKLKEHNYVILLNSVSIYERFVVDYLGAYQNLEQLSILFLLVKKKTNREVLVYKFSIFTSIPSAEQK